MICGAEACNLGAMIHGAELRVHFLKSFQKGSTCENLSKKGLKSKKKKKDGMDEWIARSVHHRAQYADCGPTSRGPSGKSRLRLRLASDRRPSERERRRRPTSGQSPREFAAESSGLAGLPPAFLFRLLPGLTRCGALCCVGSPHAGLRTRRGLLSG
jgi:hypothetical protein